MPHPEYASDVLNVAIDPTYSNQGDAYDGTTLAIVPAHAIVTQGVRPKRQWGAQWRNWIDSQFASIFRAVILNLADIETNVADLESDLAEMQGTNWPYGSNNFVTADGGAGLSAISWDPFRRRWVTLSAHSSHAVCSSSIDSGVTWVQQGDTGTGLAAHPFCLMVRPDTGDLVALQQGSAIVSTDGGVTFTNHATPLIATVQTIGDFGIWFSGKYNIFCHSAGTAALITSPDGIAWTDRSAQIPNPDLISEVQWLAAASASRIVALPWGSANRHTIYSSDGITYTEGTYADIVHLVGTDLLTGLAYSSVDNLFMLTTTGTGNLSKIFTSPDGITWTYVRSLANPMFGLSALGILWTAITGASLRSPSMSRTLFSVDRGVTWANGSPLLGLDASANKEICGTFAADTHVLAANSMYVLGSLSRGMPANLA
jgi:hypothetical protein